MLDDLFFDPSQAKELVDCLVKAVLTVTEGPEGAELRAGKETGADRVSRSERCFPKKRLS